MPVAEKKYKIVVLAKDSTEAYNFILTDRAARRLIRKTVTKMLAENEMCVDNIFYPAIIKNIVGKECTFKIEIKDDNVLIKSKIFTATDAYDDSLPSASSSSSSMPGFSETSIPENLVDLSEGEYTPGSAKSVCKKIKTEK
ncbi:hypothetical protein POM88_034839 [Heracleum sosnowskyi]|uniref:Uncharacterized protein n=1 Tax=Heracleum sosnowskyi TaxID=360622 RepID=A0AAD8MDD3_9APIA|nr:hypothetical protein POM88_033922 [Heracleum sosnowskyi]KAK1368747.1 hypothetical protein POM88_034839 [Heracleum sosnowskyi]